MKILKKGELKKTEKEFHCKQCGCVFIADRQEYFPASYAASLFGKYEFCNCPCCGEFVYIER